MIRKAGFYKSLVLENADQVGKTEGFSYYRPIVQFRENQVKSGALMRKAVGRSLI
jgi:hypothetical protein